MKLSQSLIITLLGICLLSPSALAGFNPPASSRAVLDFNPGWKFFKGNPTNAGVVDFDDSKWADVATPHTFNDVDTFRNIMTRSGDRTEFSGITWYRKHFKLPVAAKDQKVFIEFEGLRQAAWFYVNGALVGKYENGVTPVGLDLTAFAKFGGDDNVIAVKVDNTLDYREEATGTSFEWNTRDFNPMYGGIVRNVRLHLTGKVYQTLPLYENLQTTGVYVYGSDFDIGNQTCTINIESEIRNESGDQRSIDLSVVVVDADGQVCGKFKGDTVDMVGGETTKANAAGKLKGIMFWSPATPVLYDVYTILTVDGKTVDVVKTHTGFRKAEFKGGAGTGGVYLNDKFVWLTGYAQRSSQEWPAIGGAYPDWLHDYDARLVRASSANYIRWMHIAPQPADVRSCDRFGIVEVCPAGDKERDAEGRQWEQRVEVMRDTIVYFRNSPSILFWEAGNQVVTPAHMQQMVDLRKQYDPSGGRVMGTRHGDNSAATAAITPIAEYYGVMIAQDPRTDALASPADIFRGYSAERRDRAPFIESEDFREEAARRFWDNYSPPHFGFKPKPNDTWNLNSESFCIAAAKRYNDYFSNVITNADPRHARWSAYASIIWADTISMGRQYGSEVARVSGKVDGMRIPKQAFYVYRVMQNDAPDIHIIGHWNYPTNTVKTIFVAASHCDSVELLVNGKSQGISKVPTNGYIFPFTDIKFEAGKISAIARANGKIIAQDQIETVGEPKALKLTPIVSPDGFKADGSDVALFDVEVVDALGRRCPTDEGRVDFKLEGPAIWRGGYNSGQVNSINKLWLETECGINRVAIRSTQTSGEVVLTAMRSGLEPATVRVRASKQMASVSQANSNIAGK